MHYFILIYCLHFAFHLDLTKHSHFQLSFSLESQSGGRPTFSWLWMFSWPMGSQEIPWHHCITHISLCWPATWTCYGWQKQRVLGQKSKTISFKLKLKVGHILSPLSVTVTLANCWCLWAHLCVRGQKALSSECYASQWCNMSSSSQICGQLASCLRGSTC